MKDIIIGVDAGTSVIKSIAFDLQGVQIDSASENNEYSLRVMVQNRVYRSPGRNRRRH